MASYFLYCSAAAALFITARDRCLEAGDKHSGALDEQLAARMDESNIWGGRAGERPASSPMNLFAFFVFFSEGLSGGRESGGGGGEAGEDKFGRSLVVFLLFFLRCF